jgi:hypothetical protein
VTDAFDPAFALVHNSPVPDWPVGTTLTSLEIRADGVHVEFTRKDGDQRWPDVTPPGWGGPIQYTLWFGMQIGGSIRWHIAGLIEYWHDLDANGGDITKNNQIAVNWTYDCGEMARQPLPGERVAFFVTAGDQRKKDVWAVHERSQVVIVPFPATTPTVFTFAPSDPNPPPVPEPEPPPVPPVDLGPLYSRIENLEQRMAAHEAAPLVPLPDYIGVGKLFGYPITVRSKPLYE